MGKLNTFFIELKKIKWSFAGNRHCYIESLVSSIPGKLGNKIRAMILLKWFKSVGENVTIQEHVNISNPQNMVIGNNSIIGRYNSIQAAGGLTIGNYVLTGPGVKIWTSNHKFTDPNIPIRLQGEERKEVIIEDDCWIGANAFIMPGAYIAKGSVVSAGAIVGAKHYKSYSIIAGNPARVIGYRGTPENNQPNAGDEAQAG